MKKRHSRSKELDVSFNDIEEFSYNIERIYLISVFFLNCAMKDFNGILFCRFFKNIFEQIISIKERLIEKETY